MRESIERGQVKCVDAVKLFEGPGAGQDSAKYREMLYLLRSMEYDPTDDARVLEVQLGEVNDKLWDAAMKLVSDDRTIIVELAKRLAAKVDRDNEFVELPLSEIESLDLIKHRFGGDDCKSRL